MPKIVALTAPSGSGKTTIAREVLKAFPQMRFSVSATTRPPRPGEVDGVDYHFVSVKTFRRLIGEGQFIEYEEVYAGRFYGTLRRDVEHTDLAHPVLLDIDVQGATTIERLYSSDALTLFIRPPSLDVLARRLQSRATETEEMLRQRLMKAAHELTFSDRFDAVIINDDLDTAIAETLRLIETFLNP